MKAIKKYLSVFLAVLMLFSAVPFAAFADELVDQSGSDENVTWTYTAATDTLYINGAQLLVEDYGALPTYKDGVFVEGLTFSHLVIGKDVKAINMKSNAKTAANKKSYCYTQGFDIAFEENSVLNSIGSYTFRCASVTSVVFSNGLETIDEYAFYNCEMLTNVSLPENLKAIQKYAFYRCPIESLELPSSLNTIGSYSFHGIKIKEIALPENLSTIGEYAFSYCENLAEIHFSENAVKLSILSSAFRNALITELKIPAYVEKIQSGAFAECENLTSVEFEVKETENGLQGLTLLGDAFYETAITSITLPQTLTSGGRISGMGKLKSVDLSKTQLKELPNYAFSNDTALTEIKFPDGIAKFGDYAFNNCRALTSIELPDTVTEIGSYAFNSCKALTSIKIPDSVTTLSVNGHQFENCSSLQYVKLSQSMESLSDSAFAYCSKLETVVMPENLVVIGEKAFYNCTDLKNIDLPDTVQTVKTDAFYRCCQADFDMPASLRIVYDYGFRESGVTKAVFQSNVELRNSAFKDCEKLTEVAFNADVKSFVHNNEIAAAAFYGCESLKSVRLPANLITIEKNAFYGCSNLETVVFPEESKLKNIYQSVFENCRSLNQITLPSSVNNIQSRAFRFCKSLKDVNLQDTQISVVNSEAFYNTALEKLVLPDTATSVKSEAFGACYNLKTIVFPEKLASISSDAFIKTPATDVTVYNPNFNFNGNTFNGANTTIRGYSGSTSALFAGENDMTFISLESGDVETPVKPEKPEPTVPSNGTFDSGSWIVTKDNELVISGEGALNTVTAYDDGENQYTFSDIAAYYNVTSVIICDGITELPAKFLYGTKFLAESEMTVSLPETLTTIGSNAFRYTNLTYVNIPDSVTSIGDYAFYGAGLKNGVKLSNNLKTINQYAFANNAFTSITIPESVETIELAAFNDCADLNVIRIPDSVTVINEGASSTRPFGFTSASTKLDDFTVECSLSSRAYQYAYSKGLNIKLDMDGDYISGFYSSKSCARWYYYTETKEFYFVSNGVQPTNHIFYYNDGTEVKAGDLDVADLIICFGVTSIQGNDGKSIFTVLDPEIITLPETLITIGDNAFSGLTHLNYIKLPDSLKELSVTAFKDCAVKSIAFGKGLRRIPDYCFKDNKTLQYVDLKGISTIGNGAFQSCTALEIINIPNGVTKIQENAFAKCLSVKEVSTESDTNSINIYSNAFADLPLCDTVKLGRGGIRYCYVDENGTNRAKLPEDAPQDLVEGIFRNLGTSTTGVSLTLGGEKIKYRADLSMFNGKNITELNVGAFACDLKCKEYFPNLKTINVAENNEVYFSYDGCLYEKNGEIITLALAPSQSKEVEIYPGTKYIDYYAFYGSKIEHVEIPEGVTDICGYAFANCSELRKITLPQSLEQIYDYAFANCTKLKLVNMPSCEYIWENAFENCTNLANILLPDNLIDIECYAFENCTSLTGLVFHSNSVYPDDENMPYLADYAFSKCTSLENIYICNNAWFCRETFEGCDNVVINVVAGSNAYAYAKEYGFNINAFTDEDVFADECAMMEDIYEGFLGFCSDEHGDVQYLTVYEPTCEQDGYIIGVCEYCSVILEEIHIDACGHNFDDIVTIAPTESTNGVEKYTCSNCGESYCNYTPAYGDSAEKTLCNVTGKVVIANDRNALSGSTPLKNVNVKLNGEIIASTGSDGIFSCKLETGVYEFVLSYNYGFDRTVYLVVTDSDVDMGNITLIACDWNKDGRINEDDYNLFRYVISSSVGDAAYLDYVDMNNDGRIDVKDLVYMNRVKGLDSSDFAYPNFVVE